MNYAEMHDLQEQENYEQRIRDEQVRMHEIAPVSDVKEGVAYSEDQARDRFLVDNCFAVRCWLGDQSVVVYSYFEAQEFYQKKPA